MFKRVLVLLDGSELSEVVLPYVEQLAGKLGSEIELVSVVEPEGTSERLLKAYIDKIAAGLKGKAAVVRSVVLHGLPAPEILSYAFGWLESGRGSFALRSRDRCQDGC